MKDTLSPAQIDKKQSAKFTFLALLVALAAFFVSHITATATKIETPKSMGDKEFSVLPNITALNWMSLGYKTFVADLIWIRALQYNNIKNEAHLAEMFADAIIDLDPDFEPVYQYASLNAVFSEDITVQGVEASTKYLLMAMDRFPTKYTYPYSVAMNYMSYYPSDGPLTSKEKRQKAVFYLQQAMQKQDAPDDIPLLISGLLNNDDASAKIKFLQQAILTEDNPTNKHYLQTRLILMTQNAGDESTILNAKRDLWHQNHHNYLTPMLDYLISFE